MAKESTRETFRRELADVERQFAPVIDKESESLWALSVIFDKTPGNQLLQVEQFSPSVKRAST